MTDKTPEPGREVRATVVNVPYYVNPEVLKPGQTVYANDDTEHERPLIVLYVEPALVCRDPNGRQVMVFAHEVERES
jgi:hypothetical protein